MFHVINTNAAGHFNLIANQTIKAIYFISQYEAASNEWQCMG